MTSDDIDRIVAKHLGVKWSHLVGQFIGKSIVAIVLGFVFGAVLSLLSLPIAAAFWAWRQVWH